MFAQAPAEDLDARIQIFGEVIHPRSFYIQTGIKDQAGDSVGLGFRFMGEISAARHWYYEIGGKLDSSSNLKYNDGVTDLTDIKVTQSYWSLGVGYLIPLGRPFSLGIHLEGRSETMAAQGAVFVNGVASANRVDAGNTFMRPWVRVSFDGSWNWGSVRPFAGLEVAATPVQTDQTVVYSVSAMDSRTLRSMAPQADAALYVGMHF
jgi:hypothetical protein